MSNPYAPIGKETYEDQLSEDVDVESKPNFIEVSSPLGAESNTMMDGGGPPVPKPVSASNDNVPASFSLGNTASSFKHFFLSCFSVDCYKPYFDVPTTTVLERIKNSVSPHKSDLFALSLLQGEDGTPITTPNNNNAFDLFGFVWISLTLIFALSAASNFNAYWVVKHHKTDYAVISSATTFVSCYVLLFPVCTYLACSWYGATNPPTLWWFLALFGYVQFSFLVMALLCIVPLAAVQWIAVGTMAGLSTVVLARNLIRAVTFPAEEEKKAKVFSFVVLVLHVAFFLVAKMVFFQSSA